MTKILGRMMVVLGAATMFSGAAIAEPAVEVLHHWVSEGEIRAVQVYQKELAENGVTWEDFAVGGAGGANSRQVLRARIASGNPPGAMQFLGLEANIWAEEGVLRDLTPIAEAEGWDEIVPTEFDSFLKSDGKWIAVPTNIHRQNNVYINKAHFDAVGGTIPTSWDELIELAEKFKAAGITPIATSSEGWQLMEMFDSLVIDLYGVDFYNKVTRDLDPEAIGSDEMKTVFEYMRKIRGLVDENFPGRDWAFATGMVVNGDAAMQIHGDWAKAEFITAGKVPGQDFLCFATPAAVPNFMYVVDAFGMFKIDNEDRQAGQAEFASIIMSPETQQKFNVLKGSIPARLDASPDAFDDCARQSMTDLHDAIELNSLVGSLSLGYTTQPEFSIVFDDVVAEHFVSDMSSDDAVELILSGIENSR